MHNQTDVATVTVAVTGGVCRHRSNTTHPLCRPDPESAAQQRRQTNSELRPERASNQATAAILRRTLGCGAQSTITRSDEKWVGARLLSNLIFTGSTESSGPSRPRIASLARAPYYSRAVSWPLAASLLSEALVAPHELNLASLCLIWITSQLNQTSTLRDTWWRAPQLLPSGQHREWLGDRLRTRTQLTCLTNPGT